MKKHSLILAILCAAFLLMASCKEENTKPTCKITSPADATEYNVGEKITLSADAADSDGTITEVQFYVDGIGIGSANSFPYSYTWKTDAVTPGTYIIKATCWDNENGSSSEELVIELTKSDSNIGKSNPATPTVTDIDGNTYNTVIIGNQCWMKENLKVRHYPNGDVIPYHNTNESEWRSLEDNNTDDVCCYYKNDSTSKYGVLYTFAAAIADNWERDNTESQGICPDGWHLPTDSEWKVLEGTIDTHYPVGDAEWDGYGSRGFDAGTHLKSNSEWLNNKNGDNSSEFTALPGGEHDFYDGRFHHAGSHGNFWSATEYDSYHAWFRSLYSSDVFIYRNPNGKSGGISVRCIKD